MVVEAEDVEISFGAQVEHPQISGCHDTNEAVSPVVGRDDQAAGAVSLTECTGESSACVTGSEGA